MIKPHYAFTNEGLRHYLPLFNMAGKNVLTVASSGDQILGCALEGARDITAFDYNEYALKWAGLKVAVAKSLPLHGFLDFYFDNPRGPIKKQQYDAVRDAVDPQFIPYWDEFVHNKIRKNRYTLGGYGGEPRADIANFNENNAYSEHGDYAELQKNLASTELKYVHMDVFDLPKLKRKYGAIFLSNIRSHVTEEVYDKFINTKFPKLIAKGGRAAVNHKHCYCSNEPQWTMDLDVEGLKKRGFSCREHEYEHDLHRCRVTEVARA